MVKYKYIPFKQSMKVKSGDRIIVDLGGIELARGIVYNPDDNLFGEKMISFWSYHGWKHLEFCKPHQIISIYSPKKEK